MNPRSPAPSSGSDSARHGAARHGTATGHMTERELRAYLIARDAVRRVKRTSTLFDPNSLPGVGDPR